VYYCHKKGSDGSSTDTGKIVEGAATTLPAPSFPLIAKLARAHGTVVVQVYIDEEGNVIAASSKSGHPLLQAAASAAAMRAKFTKTTIDGRPVKMTGTINYNFNLDD